MASYQMFISYFLNLKGRSQKIGKGLVVFVRSMGMTVKNISTVKVGFFSLFKKLNLSKLTKI